jgi:hypothetical protein
MPGDDKTGYDSLNNQNTAHQSAARSAATLAEARN